MRKIAVISVMAVFLLSLSACHTSIPGDWDIGDTLSETAPETRMYVSPPLIDAIETEYADYTRVANEIAAAFVNGDTEYLSKTFRDTSGHGFDFIKELSFIEFEQTDRGYTYREYEGETYVAAIAYYYNITVDGAGDDVFTTGGREWELRIMESGTGDIVQQFSPVGKTIGEESFKIDLPYGFDAYSCYYISNDLNIFESIYNFNLLTENPGKYSDKDREWIYYKLMVCLCRMDGGYYDGYTVDEFTERVERLFGINNIDKSLILEYMGSVGSGNVFGPLGHGWHWHYTGLVSTEITGAGDVKAIEVVIDYYGDTGGFLLAKTMKYTLVIGDGVSRLISIECVYSDDDLTLAMGTI